MITNLFWQRKQNNIPVLVSKTNCRFYVLQPLNSVCATKKVKFRIFSTVFHVLILRRGTRVSEIAPLTSVEISWLKPDLSKRYYKKATNRVICYTLISKDIWQVWLQTRTFDRKVDNRPLSPTRWLVLRGEKFEEIFRNWCAEGAILRHLGLDRAGYNITENANNLFPWVLWN